MTKEEAYKILEKATGVIQADREAHNKILEALRVIEELL